MQIMVPSNRVNISPNHILRQNFSAKKKQNIYEVKVSRITNCRSKMIYKKQLKEKLRTLKNTFARCGS